MSSRACPRVQRLVRHITVQPTASQDCWRNLERDFIGGLKRPFLVIRGQKGYLICGYGSAVGATKCGDVAGIFMGVSSHEAFLDASVKEVSEPGMRAGLRVGMSGRDALDIIRGDPPVKTTTVAQNWLRLGCHGIPGLQKPLLLISGSKGFLACGYICPAGTSKAGDAAAIFSGVSDHNAFMTSEAIAVSEPGLKLGLKVGMSGQEALDLIR